MKQSLASRALKIMLYVVFVVGVVGTGTLPWMLDRYMGYFYDAYSLQPGYRTFILGFMMVVAALGLWVIVELIRMMRSLSSDPFIMRNASALRRIGAVALAIALLFFLKCCYYVTFLTLAGGFLLLLCSLVAFTLGNLFRQAVVYKQENDLTI